MRLHDLQQQKNRQNAQRKSQREWRFCSTFCSSELTSFFQVNLRERETKKLEGSKAIQGTALAAWLTMSLEAVSEHAVIIGTGDENTITLMSNVRPRIHAYGG